MSKSSDAVPVGARRTKKRPSYGMRTVELTRGQLGFGFTLSGQGPCILSNIIAESPAHRAGLRSGDHVIAVNGKNVSKSGHDDVVRLIGNSTGLLKLQIAESYCSSSSSEDEAPRKGLDRRAPAAACVSDDENYIHGAAVGTSSIKAAAFSSHVLLPRPFHMRGNSADSTLTDFSMDAVPRPKRPSPRKRLVKPKTRQYHRVELHGSEELQLSEQGFQSLMHPSLQELRKNTKKLHQVDFDKTLLKVVVGYLGTIEMPKDKSSGGLAAIRNCIRRLRIEKKVHTLVLMCLLPDKIVLINHHGFKLAEYLAQYVTFCGMYMDDKRFFGLVTSHPARNDDDGDEDDGEDEYHRHGSSKDRFKMSTSCHVFMTEHITDRAELERRARAFQFAPSPNSSESCGGLAVAAEVKADIPAFKEFPSDASGIIDTITAAYGKRGINEEQRRPRMADDERSNSSNSDSGICYGDKDDKGDEVKARMFQHEVNENVANEEKERISQKDSSFNTERLELQHSADNLRLSVHKYLQTMHLDNPRLVTPSSSVSSSSEAAVVKASSRCSVRSLEDVRFERSPVLSRKPDFSSVVTSSPLSQLIYSSDSNLAQLADHTQPQPSLLGSDSKRGILRPCDQYPSQPGVLNPRPLSALSGNRVGNRPDSASHVDGDADQNDEQVASLSNGDQLSRLERKSERHSFTSIRMGQADANSLIGSERGIDIGRVASWATDFEKLLADPAGLRTFAEFLKKEFSHENIYFWTACERYRRLPPDFPLDLRRKMASDIIRRHLASGAAEPVNVDSHARQAAMDNLDYVTPNLFSTAQKQIYNLMKFDSFSRFLKSDLYKDTLMCEMNHKPLRFDHTLPGSEARPDPDLDVCIAMTKKPALSQQSSMDSEPSRRKSILSSWHNLRSKSKERGSCSQHNTSNDSEDNAPVARVNDHQANVGTFKLARVILPDRATTVVQTRPGETVRTLIARLLEKRGLSYTSFDVFALDNGDQPIDLSQESTSLGCSEVRVEPRVLFRLELPSKKSIGVKAKPAKLVKDVLGPILSQYGWNLEVMNVRKESNAASSISVEVDLNSTVSSIDNSRLVVWAKNSAEINSRVLEDILRAKSAVNRMHSEGVKDDATSDGASSSADPQWSRASHKSGKLAKSMSDLDEKRIMPPPDTIPRVRRAIPQPPSHQPPHLSAYHPTQTDDELYEGLKMVQRGRLEDQRGTEINFKMPDFLKRQSINKENFGPLSSRLSEPLLRRERSTPLFSSGHHDRHSLYHLSLASTATPATPSSSLPHGEDVSFLDGRIPSLAEAENLFSNPNQSRLSFGFSQSSADPIYETLSGYHPAQARRRGDPPPLPPKPRMRDDLIAPHGAEVGVPAASHYLYPPQQLHHASNPHLHRHLHLHHQPHPPSHTDERGYSVSFV